MIIQSLFESDPYARRVLPFLIPDYFESPENKLILQAIQSYTKKYETFPTYSVIKTGIIQNARLNENIVRETFKHITEMEESVNETFDPEWLFDQAEQHCQQYSMEQAVLNASEIMGDPDRANAEIQLLIQNALKISFNTDLGIDLFSQISMKECYDFYTSPQNRIECHLKELNEVFYILKKTISALLAGTGAGKTNAMCALSVGYVKRGHNVLYITGEMQDKEIAKIIYANLMNIPRNDMSTVSEDQFMGHHKTFKLKSASWGKYKIKEYAAGTANMNIIGAYIDDVQLKEGIIFDVIMLDYINLFVSVKSIASDNSYTTIKRVAEEYRALCVNKNLAGWTATQTNRDGIKQGDFDMTSTSESMGLPSTLDGYIAIIGTDDLKEQNLQIWKILKNRFLGIIDFKIAFKTQFEYGNVVDRDESDIIPDQYNNTGAKALNMAEKMKNKKFDSGIIITLDEDEKSDVFELLI